MVKNIVVVVVAMPKKFYVLEIKRNEIIKNSKICENMLSDVKTVSFAHKKYLASLKFGKLDMRHDVSSLF